MNSLKQKLVEQFQMSDGLLLLNEPIFDVISETQFGIDSFDEKLVTQGFIRMRNLLQELASHAKAGLMDESSWDSYENSQSHRSNSWSDMLFVWELPGI